MSFYFCGGFMRTKDVVVLSYQESWKDDFEQISKELQEAAGKLILRIEHVGSTSVQGLSAKPIIDIDLVVSDDTDLTEVIDSLSKIVMFMKARDRRKRGFCLFWQRALATSSSLCLP